MDLVGVLASRRLERELRRREAALREAAQARRQRELEQLIAREPEPSAEPLVALEPEPSAEPFVALEPEPRALKNPERESGLLPAQSASSSKSWECEVCGRGFYGYGSLINHRCDGDRNASWSRNLRR